MWYVYVFKDKEGGSLYVGQSSRLEIRVGEHKRYSPWWSDVVEGEIFQIGSREEALALERELIDSLLPLYNKSGGNTSGMYDPYAEGRWMKITEQKILSICEFGGKFNAKEKFFFRDLIEDKLEEYGVPKEYIDLNATMGCIKSTFRFHKKVFEDVFLNKLLLKEMEEKYYRDKSFFSLIRSGDRLPTAVVGWVRMALERSWYAEEHTPMLESILISHQVVPEELIVVSEEGVCYTHIHGLKMSVNTKGDIL